MPGPLSDAFDPEFSTAQNRGDVEGAVRGVVAKISSGPLEGKEVKEIVGVVHGSAGRLGALPLSEKEWRVIRFCLNRFLEEGE